MKYIKWFKNITNEDVPLVGGKNASLGEMYSELKDKGVEVPNGFATTSEAYFYILKTGNIQGKIREILSNLNINNVEELTNGAKKIRDLIVKTELPKDLREEIISSYRRLSKEYKEKNVDVAVRSSATAEDLPTASFAGQHETFLNIRGEKELLQAVKKACASIFTARAISYRESRGFDHYKIALSVGIQKMVRSDLACSGVLFTLDTETGFKELVLINGSLGLGDMIVQGMVIPDEFLVFKPALKKGYPSVIGKNLGTKKQKMVYSEGKAHPTKVIKTKTEERQRFILNEDEILTLAKWGVLIEKHYSEKKGHWQPMDMEWAKDGKSGKLFIVQARPETVHGGKVKKSFKEYRLQKKKKPIVSGQAIGQKIGAGKARIIEDVKNINKFKKGEVLITTMTDPDWEPIMKIASAIVTNEGGRTSHAAIVSRELGTPCIVGTKKATSLIKNGAYVTVDCSSGKEGVVYGGKLKWKEIEYKLDKIPETETKIMVNIASPDIAFQTSFLPNDGVGLAREEFIIAGEIKVHPLALINYEQLEDEKLKKKIDRMVAPYKNREDYYVSKLAEGIAQIGAAFYPKPVIVRFSDFKTNEYASLLGGKQFEPQETNPMLGWRGASRYYSETFRPAFEWECRAIKKARNDFGLKNIKIMIPFCRTVDEGRKVLKIMAKEGLKKGKDGLEIYVMCEIPSNVISGKDFLEIFDGFSIGSNDLTQLTMGIDRDSALVAPVANENNPALKELVKIAVHLCKEQEKYVGICGQAPSDYEEFAEFLIDIGIESISLNPDAVIKTIMAVSKKEKHAKN